MAAKWDHWFLFAKEAVKYIYISCYLTCAFNQLCWSEMIRRIFKILYLLLLFYGIAGQFSDPSNDCCQYGEGKDTWRGRAGHKDQRACQVSHINIHQE